MERKTSSNGAPFLRTAIVYDFDGTLARGNIQENSFLPRLGIGKESFWAAVFEEKRKHDACEILTYMRLMLERARDQGLQVTREELRRHGERAELFEGLDTWFERIGSYAAGRQLRIEHYVVSSGTDEMIKGCSIANRFERIFASRFVYDEAGNAIWPAVAINYTGKTQYLFRINKGITNSWENEPVNRWLPLEDRPIPFPRLVFIGDGDTDIPSMKMTRHQGGHAIAVYDEARWCQGTSEERRRAQERTGNLIAEDRVNFVAPADYRPGSLLEITVKGILGKIARDAGWRRDPELP